MGAGVRSMTASASNVWRVTELRVLHAPKRKRLNVPHDGRKTKRVSDVHVNAKKPNDSRGKSVKTNCASAK